jgi:tetratricopeptide (TPR) repeat protein
VNTAQLIILWYATLIISILLSVRAIDAANSVYFVVVIIIITALLVYSLRPNPKVKKRTVFVGVVGPIIGLILVGLFWAKHSSNLREEALQKEMINQAKQAEEENKRKFLEFQKSEEERKKREEGLNSLLDKGYKYCQEKRYYDAIEAYKQATVLEPTCAAAYTGLAESYDVVNMHTEAISAYQRAISLAPENVINYRLLGLVYVTMGMPEKALGPLRTATELKPDDKDAHYALCVAYLLLKYKDAAYKEYMVLTRIDPERARQLQQYLNR